MKKQVCKYCGSAIKGAGNRCPACGALLGAVPGEASSLGAETGGPRGKLDDRGPGCAILVFVAMLWFLALCYGLGHFFFEELHFLLS